MLKVPLILRINKRHNILIFHFNNDLDNNDKKGTLIRRAAFSPQTKKLIEAAQPGDVYIFKDVTGKCPGDVAGRRLNPLVFTIK